LVQEQEVSRKEHPATVEACSEQVRTQEGMLEVAEAPAADEVELWAATAPMRARRTTANFMLVYRL